MQQRNFTQKLPRQRGFARYLLLLVALFASLGASHTALAQAFLETRLTIVTRIPPGTNTTTQYAGQAPDVPPTPADPFFNGADLGMGSSFSQANGRITLSAVLVRIDASNTRPITAARLEYRVYPTVPTGPVPSFSVLNLTRASASNTSNNVRFNANMAGIDLLNQPSVLGGGNYTVEVRFVGTYSTPSGPQEISNPASTTGYRATFQVIAPLVTPPGGTTTWISTASTDWTVAANWSNGVPTRFADAIIPEKNDTNTNTVTPALLDTNPTLYEVKNLTLNGTTNATRALLRIGQTTGGATSGATLNVYGDLNTFGGGILASQSGTNGAPDPARNSTIALKGGDQIVRGLVEVADVRIEGTGVKGVVNAINASNTFLFAPGTTALVRTVSETVSPSTGVSTFTLNTSKTSNVNLKVSGTLLGETASAYVEGVTLADRNLFAGVNEPFGGIGIEINANRTIPGATIQITRTVGDPLSGPTSTSVNDPSNPSGGVAGAKPVKRQYGVSGDVNNAPTVSTVVFHYLDSPDELNGNPEANLIIFRTSNNGIPYGVIGGTVDTNANTVTQVGVTAINTITLGDRDKPLPVTLTAFDAKRVGTEALVTWETASESNSKGFNVQVSDDGKEFRTLGFVASATPNSTRKQTYGFADSEKNKSGVRYYRLQQLDLDGKTAFFAPRSVSFEGKASASSLVAYPNPFNGNDELHVAVQLSKGGKGQLRVTDMTGRTIRQEAVELPSGLADLTVGGMKELKTGIYLVRLMLPSGETQNLKVVKQ